MPPKHEEPPFFGSSLRHSPYTVEGQIEQYAALRKARGWRRAVVQGVLLAGLLAFLLSIIVSVFQARS
jgi:hypothetical protein